MSAARTGNFTVSFRNRAFAGLATAAFFAAVRPAPCQQPILLWPNGAPGATGSGAADKPGITPYPANNPNGAAVVVFPGGAYSFLATDIEGTEPAKWLQGKGISAFVVNYRVSPYRHPIEMWDGQRAMRWVRANAKKYAIDTAHIGVMGFSAGGHMASTVSTHWDMGDPAAKDSVDRQSCRPAFAIIHYGVITMDASFTHMGSRQSLLGNNPSQALVDSMSNEKQVTARTPPTFLGHGDNDHTVNVKNSQVYYDSLLKKGVTKSTLMIFKGIDHSYGLADGNAGTPNNPTVHAWCDSSLRWLDSQGFLTRTVVSLAPRSFAPDRSAPPVSQAGFRLFGPDGFRVDVLGRSIPLRRALPGARADAVDPLR